MVKVDVAKVGTFDDLTKDAAGERSVLTILRNKIDE